MYSSPPLCSLLLKSYFVLRDDVLFFSSIHATAYMLPPIPVTLATSSSFLSTMYLFYKHTFLMISFLVINGTFYLFRKISWKKHGDGTGCYHSGACRGLTIASTSKSITVAMLKSITVAMLVSSFLGLQLLRVAE